jgi:hypothetical protein
MAALFPILWTHEGDELYFGQKQVFDQSALTKTMFKKYAKLHVKFFPYINTLVKEAKETGVPVMRSLYLHYPNDVNTVQIEDEFLLGDRVLVAPVLDSAARSRSVYFPTGKWYDYWTGKLAATGPTRVTVNSPLDHLPVFIKEGSILPLYNQNHIETLVKNVPGKNDFEYANSTMELRFYGTGDDRLQLWDGTQLTAQRSAGNDGNCSTSGAPLNRVYTCNFNDSEKVISAIESSSRLRANIFPNAFESKITITLDNVSTHKVKVSIADLVGRPIYQTEENSSSFVLDLSFLHNGIYAITIETGNGKFTERIIKR